MQGVLGLLMSTEGLRPKETKLSFTMPQNLKMVRNVKAIYISFFHVTSLCRKID